MWPASYHTCWWSLSFQHKKYVTINSPTLTVLNIWCPMHGLLPIHQSSISSFPEFVLKLKWSLSLCKVRDDPTGHPDVTLQQQQLSASDALPDNLPAATLTERWKVTKTRSNPVNRLSTGLLPVACGILYGDKMWPISTLAVQCDVT